MPRPLRTALWLSSAVLLLAACGRPSEEPKAPVTQATTWEQQRDAFIEADLAADPGAAVYQGRHEYDGRLADSSRAGIAKNIARLHAARDAFSRLPAAGLSAAASFERDYLLQVIDGQLFWLEVVQQPFTRPTYYLDQLDASPYLERDYAPLATRLRGYIGYLRAMPAVLQAARENLRLPLVASFVDHALVVATGMAEFYGGDARAVFDGVEDPGLRAALDAATRDAVAAANDFAKYLAVQRSQATQDFALGPEKFTAMLRVTERVTTPLPALKAAGEADLARNLAALRIACAKFAPRRSLPSCLDKARAHKSSGGAIEGARAQLAELRQFVEEKDIVSIPKVEAIRVAESPPQNRADSVYISLSGPYEKRMDSVYYISPPDPQWTRTEREDYLPGVADLLFVSVHEVWPGHFLQFLHAHRVASPVGRLYVGSGFAEGWAHYAEELMLEKGLHNGDPEAQVGQLYNALLRNVRFLSAIGLHTEGMTLQQSERMFTEQAFQDPGNARQQSARGTYDPGYLNYTLGKLMIRKLRTDWRATRGGEAAWKAFHDQFLSYGGPPIPLVRRAMLGEARGALL